MTCETKITFDSAQWKSVSREAIDICMQLLMKKPEERLTIDKLLAHPWFKKLSLQFMNDLLTKDSI